MRSRNGKGGTRNSFETLQNKKIGIDFDAKSERRWVGGGNRKKEDVSTFALTKCGIEQELKC